ncbi:hypothetical protein WICPIJ_005958 [Wickerhamomyces pijperi]|uniref:Zn(2)-C6 fungal-type domain-containing protein n=1 Tax=Wickerhamomyces pijperi TaxID=599730 RepID=A0A9P8Q4N8_WICPI|nr:hypothetical protein WICPIJ_005958 [Wickerhamomyces pijperi]
MDPYRQIEDYGLEPLSEDFLYNPALREPTPSTESANSSGIVPQAEGIKQTNAVNLVQAMQQNTPLQAQANVHNHSMLQYQQQHQQFLPHAIFPAQQHNQNQEQIHLQASNHTTPSSANSSPLDTLQSPDSEYAVQQQTAVRSNSKQSKTKRRNKPCNQCRIKKVKCIKLPNEPHCQECLKKHQDCEFDKTTSYAQVIENYNATCDNCIITRTKCVRVATSKSCLECSIKGLKGSCKFTKGKKDLTLINNNEPVLDYDGTSSSKDKTTTSINSNNNSNSDEETTGGANRNTKGKGRGKYHGLLTNSLHLQSLNNCIPLNPSSTGLIERTIITKDIQSIDDLTTSYHEEILFRTFKDPQELIHLSTQQCDEVERLVQPYGLNLINLYFQKVQPYYPIIDQRVFLEKYSRTHKEINPLLLVAVYLHAVKFRHLDRKIRVDEADVGKLENLMELYFLESLNNYKDLKFSNIQSFMLLLQYEGFVKSKKLMNELVYVAEELGLNYKNLRISNWENDIRLRLSWALKVWDKLHSVLDFKSSKISESNWSLEPLSEVENVSSFFSVFVKLAEVLTKILNSLQNQRSYEEDAFAIVSIKYDQCLSALNGWLRSFEHRKPDSQCQFISLRFLYYQLAFSLDRRVVKSYGDMQSIITMGNSISNIDTVKYQSVILPGIKRRLCDFKELFASEFNQEVLYDEFWVNKRITITDTLISFFILAKAINSSELIDQFNDVLQLFRSEEAVVAAMKHVKKFYL